MSNIIDLNSFFNSKTYKEKISNFCKLGLLQEFAEWRDEPGIADKITEDWKNRGRILLPALYDQAETNELRSILKEWYKEL